jgi:hypothetical protein
MTVVVPFRSEGAVKRYFHDTECGWGVFRELAVFSPVSLGIMIYLFKIEKEVMMK